MTSAGCVHNTTATDWQVFGDQMIISNETKFEGQINHVKKIVIHKQFSPYTHANDIAIIFVSFKELIDMNLVNYLFVRLLIPAEKAIQN